MDLGLLVSIVSNLSLAELEDEFRLRAEPQIWNHSIQGGCLLVLGKRPGKKKLETVGSDKLIDANRCAKVNITKVIKVQFMGTLVKLAICNIS